MAKLGAFELIWITVFLPIWAWAELSPPAYVSEQPRITSEAMEMEIEQFKSRSAIEKIKSSLRLSEDRRDQSKKELERALGLFEKKQLTETQLLRARQNLQFNEDAVIRNRTALENAKTSVEVSRSRILEEGNAEADYRLEVARSHIKALRIERQNLTASLQNAELNLDYFKNRYANGEFLFERQVISLQELEQRKLELHTAQDQVSSWTFQIQGVDQALNAMEKTEKALLKKGRRALAPKTK